MRVIAIGLVCLIASLGLCLPAASAARGDEGDPEVKSKGNGSFVGSATIRPDSVRGISKRGRTGHKRVVATVLAKAPEPRMTKAEWSAFLAMCLATYGDSGCSEKSRKATKPDQKEATIALDAIARQLIVKLQLPDPAPRFGPDPAVNEWKMAAVGYPLWLWTDGPATVSSTVRAYGVSFTLRAAWLSTTFAMGDGHQVTCTETRSYPKQVKAGTKSPVCGYTYLKSSLPKGSYTVTATTNWRITWRALGRSGVLVGSHTGGRSLPVGELNALIVR